VTTAEQIFDVLTFGPLRRAAAGEPTSSAPPAPRSATLGPIRSAADAQSTAELLQANARNAVKASFTSEVSKIEAMPHGQERLARASQTKNALDGLTPWVDTGPTWDTYQGLLARLRRLRNDTMGKIGKSATGRDVQTDAAFRAQHGTPLTAAAEGFVDELGDRTRALGAGASSAIEQAVKLAPWALGLIGLVLVLQIVRSVR
jgi:hypothetical protein